MTDWLTLCSWSRKLCSLSTSSSFCIYRGSFRSRPAFSSSLELGSINLCRNLWGWRNPKCAKVKTQPSMSRKGFICNDWQLRFHTWNFSLQVPTLTSVPQITSLWLEFVSLPAAPSALGCKNSPEMSTAEAIVSLKTRNNTAHHHAYKGLGDVSKQMETF